MVRPLQHSDIELELFAGWKGERAPRRVLWAFGGSLVLHFVIVTGLYSLPPGALFDRPSPEALAQLRSPVKLVAPAELTQLEPNRGKPSKTVDLEGLLPQPRLQIPPSLPGEMGRSAPVVVPPSTPERSMAALPEPPKVDTGGSRLGQTTTQQPAGPPGAAPQIQSDEKPKLAFEKPSAFQEARASRNNEVARLARPGHAIEEAGRALAQGRTFGGIVVGDAGGGEGGLGEGLNVAPSPGKSGSSLELLSDPKGVDFRPYLVTVLAAVRRNWFAVMPESAKYGRRGRVVIQFAVSRDGSVPKLVIAVPSGAEALDRAAVAGISASNPFPPLPSNFRGESVRLQLVFLYNLRAN